MGLLARAYINGAGYDLKDIDGVSFLEKAYDTATTMINNKAIYTFLAELDEPMTADYDKLFPFGIVPMFTLSNTRFGDIYTYLATVQGMYKFCK